MRNLKKSKLSIDDAYAKAKHGLSNPKRQFMIDQEQTLKQSYAKYDQLAVTGKLKSLQSLWTDADEKSYTFIKKKVAVQETYKHRNLAYDLYWSDRPIIDKLWEELEILNSTVSGERQELICPVCGLRPCKQMDHHAPRAHDKFPEYSVHLSNLIPLCDDCNETKSSYWLEEENNIKYRIWFNAYYDTLPSFEIFVPSIVIVGGLPLARVELSPDIDRKCEIHDVIFRTVKKLGLISKYQSCLNDRLRSFIERKTDYYQYEKVRYKDADEYWCTIKNNLQRMLTKNTERKIDESMFYKAVINSMDFETWMLNELNKKQ